MKYFALIALLVLMFPLVNATGQEFVIGADITMADGESSAYRAVSPGDTIWLQSGTRSYLRIVNFHGMPGKPVVFANRGGQVIIDTDHYYGISFANCSFFKLAGRSGPGHQYGIRVSRVGNPSGAGISADKKSTDLELENCEISNADAGILAKTSPDCNDPETFRDAFTQFNTIIHDCYIHDITSEGMYIGNTAFLGLFLSACNKTVLPSVLKGVRIYNNRIERTGYDGIQVTSAVSDCEIHHNVLIECGSRMVSDQKSGILIGGGTLAKCYSNRVIDCHSTGILVFGNGGTEIFNNLIIRPGRKSYPGDPLQREHGIFLSDKTGVDKTFYGVYNNTIIQPKSDGIRIDNTVDFPVRIYNNAIVDPGAFNVYETDNTGYTGQDSYIFDTGGHQYYVAMNNYLETNYSKAGFANMAEDDFHPLSTSPLVNSGLNLGQAGVLYDLDDRPRPYGPAYDIGAYEYSGSQFINELSGNPDFSVTSVRQDHGGSLIINIDGPRKMNVGVMLTDVLGRVLYENRRLEINPGENEMTIPAGSGGMVILFIHSDRLRYARKIIVI